MTAKFPECTTCYFKDREPAICESCIRASQYEPADLDQEALADLRDLADQATNP